MAKILDTFKDRELELGPLAGAAAGPVEALEAGARRRRRRLARASTAPGPAPTRSTPKCWPNSTTCWPKSNAIPPKGLVIRSAKRSGFIAGADINQFTDSSGADVAAGLTQAHAVIDRLDNLKIPTVAVIHGFCLGGGLEVALACDYRIATEDARLGFPEVMLGLHPGLGGTVRLHAADQSDRGDDRDADRPQSAARGAPNRSVLSMR